MSRPSPTCPVDGTSSAIRWPMLSWRILDFSFDQLERYSNRPAIQHRHKDLLFNSRKLDIRLNTTLVDIDFEENGDVAALRLVRRDGTVLHVEVNNLVLACGGLETARQLLVAQRKHPGMFGGPAGPLGKFYMGHVTGEISDITFYNNRLEEGLSFYLDEDGTYIRRRLVPSPSVQSKHELSNIVFWPVVPPIFDASHRSGILSLLFLAMATKPIGRRLIAEVIRQKHAPADIRKWPHIENVLREMPRSASLGFSYFCKRYLADSRLPGFFLLNSSHRYGLSYHAEQLPNESSRVYLNGAIDKLGTPRLSIDFKFSEEDALPILRAHELLGDWLEKNGLGKIEYRQRKEETIERILAIASHGTHQIGLARMGECRNTGIVDRNLRSFDSRNLYLLSSAVFPSSGQCNPTLSIVALAVRLAEHLSRGEIIEKGKYTTAFAE